METAHISIKFVKHTNWISPEKVFSLVITLLSKKSDKCHFCVPFYVIIFPKVKLLVRNSLLHQQEVCETVSLVSLVIMLSHDLYAEMQSVVNKNLEQISFFSTFM